MGIHVEYYLLIYCTVYSNPANVYTTLANRYGKSDGKRKPINIERTNIYIYNIRKMRVRLQAARNNCNQY